MEKIAGYSPIELKAGYLFTIMGFPHNIIMQLLWYTVEPLYLRPTWDHKNSYAEVSSVQRLNYTRKY